MLNSSSDEMITLYRGITGSESGNGVLFLAEQEAYAAAYSGTAQSVQIPQSAYFLLTNEGLIYQAVGQHVSGMSGREFYISNPIVKRAIVSLLK